MPSRSVTPALPIAAMRALGSISRNAPNAVPVLVCAQAGAASTHASATSRHARAAAQSNPRPPGRGDRRLFDDRELADIFAHPSSADLEHVETRRHVQIVLRAQIPWDVALIRPVLLQRAHEIAVHRVDANG